MKGSGEFENVGPFELVCVKSSIKFLRAGYANVLLFIGAIFASISWEFLVEIEFGKHGATVVAGGISLIFVWYYSTFVSRISEENGVIHALKAFTDVRIPVASISSIRTSSIGLSNFAKITIEQEGSAGIVRLRFIAPVTNIGTFRSTIAALEEFTQRHSQ